MTISLPLLLAGASLLLVLAALALIPSKSERELKKRAMQLGTTGGEELTGRPRQALRQLTAEERPLWDRTLAALGRNPDIPEAYRIPPLVMILVSGLAAGFTFWASGERFGPAGTPVVALLAATGMLMVLFRRERSKYQSLLLAQIPDGISLVLRAVRTGLPVVEALRTIAQELPAPINIEFGRVSQEVAIGVPIEDALWSLHDRSELQEFAFLAVTVGLQAQAGGNLTETLANLADLVRKRVAMVSKVKAITAEARTSAAILIGLPFVVALLLLVLQPDYVADLFTHRKSGTLQAMFVILMGLGISVINWLIAQAIKD
jgi:tight adherence protein B